MVRILPLRKFALALVAGAGFALSAGTAQAEDLDRVVDKLDRVERDLRELQYEVYKGHPPATQATGAPLAPANATRINDLEASLRELR